MSRHDVLDHPRESAAAPVAGDRELRPRARERLTIARAAVIVALVLDATAIALALSAAVARQQAVYLGAQDPNSGGILGILTLGGLALLGAVAAGIAAVNQQPRRISSWVALIASGVGFLAILLSSLALH